MLFNKVLNKQKILISLEYDKILKINTTKEEKTTNSSKCILTDR